MANTTPRTAELRRRLSDLEAEYSRLATELAAIDARAPLPGVFLVVEVEGAPALLPGAAVHEVVRLVEHAPLPGAPPWVLGTFVFRGRSVVTLDLSRFMGRPARMPSLDAHVVVLGSGALMGIMVDRVRGLVEAPVALDAESSDGNASTVFGSSTLISSLCRVGDDVLPLLRVAKLMEALPLEVREQA
ncbi:MAG: chemotaxis protein CheW [Myxococcaceae bacterium]